MRDLIKKILKENRDEFDWVREIPPTSIEVLGEDALQKVLDGEIILTHMINVLYQNGVKGSIEIHDAIGGRIIDEIRPGIEKNQSNNRFMFIMYFTSLLDGVVLREAFKRPLQHSHFGEGGEDMSTSYASYMLKIDNKYVHIGYDGRGTSVDLEEGTTLDEAGVILSTIVDETIKYIQPIQ